MLKAAGTAARLWRDRGDCHRGGWAHRRAPAECRRGGTVSRNITRKRRPRFAAVILALRKARGNTFFKIGLRRQIPLRVMRTRHQLAPAVTFQKTVNRRRAGPTANRLFIGRLEIVNVQHLPGCGGFGKSGNQGFLFRPCSCWRGCVRLWALASRRSVRGDHTPYGPSSPCSTMCPSPPQAPARSAPACATSPFASVDSVFYLSLYSPSANHIATFLGIPFDSICSGSGIR